MGIRVDLYSFEKLHLCGHLSTSMKSRRENGMLVNSRFRKKLKIGILFLSLMLIFVTPQMHYAYASGFVFDPQINLSNNAGDSTNPQIIQIGGNVYIVWQDITTGFSEILFVNSTDSGVTFDAPINLSNSAAISQSHQITVSGNNIFVVWDEGNDILFTRSINNGDSFVAIPTTFTNLGGSLAAIPKVIASGNNVTVAWQAFLSGNNEILFVNSTNSGTSFDTPINLSNSVGSSTSPKISSVDNFVFVVWREGSDILFLRSTDYGDTFPGPVVNISNSATSSPQIAVSGSDVYIVWNEGLDIFLIKSDNSGSTFPDPPQNISNTPAATSQLHKIAASGINVHIVWKDNPPVNGDIFIRSSIDSGANFGTTINLSNTSGVSGNPQVSASGSNVYVTWEEATPLGSNPEIFFSASNDSGVTFGCPLNISNNSGESKTPGVTSSGNNAFVVWDDNTDDMDGDGDILFRTGSILPLCITFDSNEYKLSDTATLKIVDAASNTDNGQVENITPTVTSTSDGVGIMPTLTETGPATGEFTGDITFTSGASSGSSLNAIAGDTISATFSGQTGSATIFPITINFQLGGTTFTSFDYSHIVNLLVEDQNANTGSGIFETISVDINSSIDPTGITLTLNETGVDTGMFGGVSSTLIFLVGDVLFQTTGDVNVTQENAAANMDPGAIESVNVTVESTTDGTGIILSLNETSVDSGEFSGVLTLTASPSIPGSAIQVAGGDIVSVFNSDTTANQIVHPNPNSSIGEIQVNFPGGEGVVATYEGVSQGVAVQDTLGPGGGGGGIVRPGLVFNILAGISLFGGGGGSGGPISTLDRLQFSSVVDIPDDVQAVIDAHDPNKPIEPMKDDGSFDFPLSIDGDGYPLASFSNTIKTKTLTTDTPITIKTTSYSKTDLEHVTLYTNLRGTDREIIDSDTFIRYTAGEPLEIVDPHGYIKSAEVIITKDGFKNLVEFKIIFAKSMEKSDILFRSWDQDKRSSDVKIRDAIEVKGNNEEDAQLTLETQITETKFDNIPTEVQIKPIPSWIKATATWWSDDEINDSEFVLGIQYLIQEDIIQIPDSEITSKTVVQTIPSWIKDTANWWGQDLISDPEFTAGLQWLIDNGVMKV